MSSVATPAEEAEGQARAGSPGPVLTVLYGSETGNAEAMAEHAAQRALEKGLRARVLDMGGYDARRLRDERLLLIVTATHGEGDPPEPAQDFCDLVESRKAPSLKGIDFAVLGLGDSSYEHFCQTGKDLDARLEGLGATRVQERADCDIDYEEVAPAWIDRALDRLLERAKAAGASTAPSGPAARTRSDSAPRYGRRNPFPAEVLDRVVLTGRGSSKETFHLELALEGSGLTFEPGDVLCVVPENHPDLVDELLAQGGWRGDEAIETRRGERSLRDALQRACEITELAPPVLRAYAERSGDPGLASLLREENRQRLGEYRHGRDVIDMLRDFPVSDLRAQELIEMLRPLKAREYSIASSPDALPEEVHLTIGAVRYEAHGRTRYGVASTYLADRLEPGEAVPVYVQRNKSFKLPADSSVPIIMIGPGTGIAPFRAFLQQREHDGADGANWLFFGEQHFRSDFLYQTEWQEWLNKGILDRIDLAFSRDGPEKVYVQHRLLEHGREIYEWIRSGAHIYVCGDAERMAPDVHRALETIVEREAGLSPEDAKDYLKELQREQRYQRDVY